jgi:hypothetical protein
MLHTVKKMETFPARKSTVNFLLRQKYSRPVRVNIPQAEAFPPGGVNSLLRQKYSARKSNSSSGRSISRQEE